MEAKQSFPDTGSQASVEFLLGDNYPDRKANGQKRTKESPAIQGFLVDKVKGTDPFTADHPAE